MYGVENTNFTTACPHCPAGIVNFLYVASHPGPELRSISHEAFKTVIAYWRCQACSGGIVTRLLRYDRASFDLNDKSGNINRDQFIRVDKQWPKRPKADVPDHVPERLAGLYSQGLESLDRGLWDAAGGVLRKVLDISVKRELGEESDKYNKLFGRIDALADKNILPPAMQKWAHAIRSFGNDAAHEEIYTKEEARTIERFIYLYLTYVYTMPEMLKKFFPEEDARDPTGKTPAGTEASA